MIGTFVDMRSRLYPWVISLSGLLLWEVLVRTGSVSGLFFPAPSRVVATLLGLARSGELARHLGVSLQRVVLGFLIGGSAGLAVGWLTGWLPRLRHALDPLVAAITMGAARIFVPAMFASLGMVLLTLIFGRVFCGWICPLGTLIDGAAKVFDPPEKRFSEQTHERMLRWKYWILAGVLVAAIFSCQLVFLLNNAKRIKGPNAAPKPPQA